MLELMVAGMRRLIAEHQIVGRIDMSNGSDHPWLRPLWRASLIVVLCAAGQASSFTAAESFWGTLFGGMAVYALWVYIIKYRRGSRRPISTTPEKKE